MSALRILTLIAMTMATWTQTLHAATDGPAAADRASGRPPSFVDVRKQPPVDGNVHNGEGRATVCAACHGPKGIAVAPNFPNLAGQSATYLYLQLKQFKDGQRGDPIMSVQAANLSDDDMRNLAAYYASLPSKPHGSTESQSAGAQLYLGGDAARGIPPCQGCHGADAIGVRVEANGKPQPPWVSFPRLRGQSVLYVAKELHDFREGTRSGSSNAKIMQAIAGTLSDDDIQQLSTYLSSR
ncbi:c-type cytochrome [Dyella jiangningensis]|uniref:c-type cytochrome n=1 Tax=Dyella jiangningensis TaxID=1379159 RepID=UPI00240F2F3A|nr:c-type cytochrome [Dyella jiangningensis]MDG2536353.1 c-type cytochrome [Dyella jiangningensis]